MLPSCWPDTTPVRRQDDEAERRGDAVRTEGVSRCGRPVGQRRHRDSAAGSMVVTGQAGGATAKRRAAPAPAASSPASSPASSRIGLFVSVALVVPVDDAGRARRAGRRAHGRRPRRRHGRHLPDAGHAAAHRAHPGGRARHRPGPPRALAPPPRPLGPRPRRRPRRRRRRSATPQQVAHRPAARAGR